MLTFFRKIRKSLIHSGSLRNYLLYGIGEIFLVMVGILLALQVNNWNENRKAKDAETESLKSLVEEFQKNQTDLQEHIEWKQYIGSQWDTFLMTISNKELPSQKKVIRRPTASYANYIISNSILNSLLSSGKIDNVKNDSLKYMLTTWQDVVMDYQQFQQMHSDFVLNNLMVTERTLIPAGWANENYMPNPFISIEKEKDLIIKAYDNMTYQNLLTQNYYWITIQLRRIQELEEKMGQIIKLLENEIDHKKS